MLVSSQFGIEMIKSRIHFGGFNSRDIRIGELRRQFNAMFSAHQPLIVLVSNEDGARSAVFGYKDRFPHSGILASPEVLGNSGSGDSSRHCHTPFPVKYGISGQFSPRQDKELPNRVGKRQLASRSRRPQARHYNRNYSTLFSRRASFIEFGYRRAGVNRATNARISLLCDGIPPYRGIAIPFGNCAMSIRNGVDMRLMGNFPLLADEIQESALIEVFGIKPFPVERCLHERHIHQTHEIHELQ
ncbi:hypothetical protein FHX15_005140 [Rhizobium sp. BK650]|nr:hypothetical protein [Rhizobium sp. BK650]